MNNNNNLDDVYNVDGLGTDGLLQYLHLTD